jgi:aconitate hydratase 2/2-methylisocitrate dehydratase
MSEYLEPVRAADVYRYMNFDQIKEFKEVADTVTM